MGLAFYLQAFYRLTPFGEALSKKFKNVWRLYNTVMQQPKTVEVLKSAGTTFGLVAKAKEEKKNSKEGKRAPIEGQSITAPPLEKGRFKKDFNVWTKGWEADKRKMVDKFVKNIKGGLRVGKGLSVPDWKKK
eukprot:GDKK01006633.1.p1 GENE.GDKK01006633.1~~GDKK01006633.1.p1  ORF type:complete len:132 (-),score=22.86 GDKK01006633.1:89-484(-)